MPWPVDRQYVRAAEAALGVLFPADFVTAMMADNGGEVVIDDETWALHPFWDKSDAKRASRTSNDIVRENASIREFPSFPADAVAIADSNGDKLILRRGDDATPVLDSAVYIWDLHSGKVEKVAASIAELTRWRPAGKADRSP